MHPQEETWEAAVLAAAPLPSLSSATYWLPWQSPAPPLIPQFLPAFLPAGVSPLLCQMWAELQRGGNAIWGILSQTPPFPNPSVMKSSLHELTSGKGEAHLCGMYTVTGCGLHPENSIASSVSCLAKSIIGRLASTLFREGWGWGRGRGLVTIYIQGRHQPQDGCY